MSTSRLQDLVGRRLRSSFPHLSIRENSRPEWLVDECGSCLELDFFMDSISIAIEIQGDQHYTYVPFFHMTWQGFLDQKRRDREKSLICGRHGVELLYVCDKEDIERALARIQISTDDSYRWAISAPSISVFTEYRRMIGNLRRRLLSMQKDSRLNVYAPNVQSSLKKRLRRIESFEDRFLVLRGEFSNSIMDLARSLIVSSKEIEDYRAKRKSKPLIKLPGSRDSRARARKRFVKSFQDYLYLVSGGYRQHVVWFYDEKNFVCDCYDWEKSTDKVCCHIYAVMIYLGIHK